MFRYVVVAVTAVAVFLLLGTGIGWLLRGPGERVDTPPAGEVKLPAPATRAKLLPEEAMVWRLLVERCPDAKRLEAVKWGPHDLVEREREIGRENKTTLNAKIVRLVFRTANVKGGMTNHDALFCIADGKITVAASSTLAIFTGREVGDDWQKQATTNLSDNLFELLFNQPDIR